MFDVHALLPLLQVPPEESMAEALRFFAVMLVPIAGTVGLFTWLAVVGFARQRRLEREAYYRGEVNKRLAEEGRLSATELLAAKERDRRDAWLARREVFKLSGLVMLAIGMGLIVVFERLHEIDAQRLGFLEQSALGVFPFALGGALLLYGTLLYPKFETRDDGRGVEEGP